MISFLAENVATPQLRKRLLNKWIRQVAKSYGKKVGEVAYIFVDDERILEVNRQYLQHDYYTDIITFDYTVGDSVSGDIFISVDTVRSNSVEFGTPFEEEFHRVVIHGVLHLCGIDDKGAGQREIMEAAENKALALLAEMERFR